MIDAHLLADRFARFLGEETEAADVPGGGITLLTPAEYPDADGVAVYVEPHPEGGYVVTDKAAADSLLVGYLNPRRAANKAKTIAARFDVSFDRGSVVARADDMDLAETCWRIAQASAAIAEAVSFLPSQATPQRDFDTLVAGALKQRGIEVERDRVLRGLSGHEHKASLFVPATEAVVEPITGRKMWERATKVYAEFGDLRQANGYQLIAVLDDRDYAADGYAGEGQLTSLLSQVGRVATWSRHEEWLSTIAVPPSLESDVRPVAPPQIGKRRGGRRPGRRRRG